MGCRIWAGALKLSEERVEWRITFNSLQSGLCEVGNVCLLYTGVGYAKLLRRYSGKLSILYNRFELYSIYKALLLTRHLGVLAELEEMIRTSKWKLVSNSSQGKVGCFELHTQKSNGIFIYAARFKLNDTRLHRFIIESKRAQNHLLFFSL